MLLHCNLQIAGCLSPRKFRVFLNSSTLFRSISYLYYCEFLLSTALKYTSTIPQNVKFILGRLNDTSNSINVACSASLLYFPNSLPSNWLGKLSNFLAVFFGSLYPKPVLKYSGKQTTFAPFFAASIIYRTAFLPSPLYLLAYIKLSNCYRKIIHDHALHKLFYEDIQKLRE